jgi:acetyl-CoA carboxylase biotin carboxyl carrier protein
LGRIRITKRRPAEPVSVVAAPAATAAPPLPADPAPTETAATPAEAAQAVERDSSLVAIVAPMVGTFYSAPAPGAKPYVNNGEPVSVGQVVCIVEAMKLMNEVQSEVSGRVTKICVENGQAVEYGQELFLVAPV